MGRALISAHLVMRLRQHHHATRAEHDVIVEILAHRLIQRARLFIDRSRGVLQVIGANNCRVAACVATAQPAFFNHRHIGDAEILAQIIGSGQAMPTSANNHHVIGFFCLGIAPGTAPTAVLTHRLTRDSKD